MTDLATTVAQTEVLAPAICSSCTPSPHRLAGTGWPNGPWMSNGDGPGRTEDVCVAHVAAREPDCLATRLAGWKYAEVHRKNAGRRR